MTAPAPTSTLATVADPDSRGTTTLADRVVEKIAARAASEVDHCTGIPRTIAGIGTGTTAVQVDAISDGAITGLTLRLGIEYPAPITSTTRRIRGHVSNVVQQLCGLRVDHIDITVAALARPARTEKRGQ